MVGTGVEDIGDDDTTLEILLLFGGKVVGCAFTSVMRSSYFRNLPFIVPFGGGCQATNISWELRLCAAVIIGAPDGAISNIKKIIIVKTLTRKAVYLL